MHENLQNATNSCTPTFRLLEGPRNQLQDDALCPGRLHHQGFPITIVFIVIIINLIKSCHGIDAMLIYTRKGELITELCFVVAGSLEVVQDGEILAFLGRSVYFHKTMLGFCSA